MTLTLDSVTRVLEKTARKKEISDERAKGSKISPSTSSCSYS
jgi:hypothetical protein